MLEALVYAGSRPHVQTRRPPDFVCLSRLQVHGGVRALHTHYDVQRIFLLATAGTLATNHHGLSIANRYLLLLRFHLREYPASGLPHIVNPAT